VEQYFFSVQIPRLVTIETAQFKWVEEDAKIRTLLDDALKYISCPVTFKTALSR